MIESQGFFNFRHSPEFKNKLKLTLSGISGAFMLPISTLAITALFLALGGFLQSVGNSNEGLKAVGQAVKSISFPILQAIPLLFCVAFAVAFCNNDPTYVWGSIIGYLVFLSTQNAFIKPNGTGTEGYKVLFPGAGRDEAGKFLVTRNLGIISLNTSIFGSLLIGGVMMPYLKKNWGEVKLPTYISFFSGKRFIPLAAALGGAWLGSIFLLFWPWIGHGFSWVGNKISNAKGVDSFIFGFLEKSLIPFGLHHMFYSPLWYSSLGGDVVQSLQSPNELNGNNGGLNCAAGVLKDLLDKRELSSAMWHGDSFIGMSAISLPSNEVNGGKKVMDFLDEKGIKVGRFTQGKYPVMQFGLPAVALAMWLAADPKNRKEASATLVPAALNTFLMGITEPIEFTFLFLAPKLFYCFHTVMCGASFALMNILGAHIPSIFSGGLFEFLLLGVLPLAKGTKPECIFIVGGILAPIYYWVFTFAIWKYDLPTPGRIASAITQEATKESNSKVPEKTRKLAIAFGGWDNLGKISNCASRLRYDIIDKSKVNEAGLKAAGALAVKWVGDNHVQVIVGPKAEEINNEMVKWRGEALE
ncbi:PTS transporter subunit EIIC [Candidatus Mycoplasma haematobovis]|uniref:PTS transporter subunit EIIC n=1 Tax=Candidatus Mycoplasma haematobovis TaxID=432608 RepID=UPI001FE09386|nr:PTS transporter subunit EIIC [Candidatus Mycoplasma haematobovis]